MGSFAEFWPHYLRAHADPRTRLLHYAGTSVAILFILAAVATAEWRWLIGAPIAGYAFAWLGHFRFEHNRPATFDHPLWSLRGDVTMLYLWATGRLGRDLERSIPASTSRRTGAKS